MLVLDDTIAAIATANQPALRGIVRVSGPAVVDVIRPHVSLRGDTPWESIQRASVWSGRLSLDSPQRTVPVEVYLWPGKRSYTRQPMAELHMVGSPPLLELTLNNLCRSGARLAAPGEFTLRAFLAGRIDLASAEGILGAIDATNDAEFHAALQQMAGGLSERIGQLRDRLLNLAADVEAGLDFVEEDIQFVTHERLCDQLAELQAEITTLIDRIQTRRLDGQRPRVVLHGAPNAGKSTLFNALSNAALAITSSQPGTTRDFLTTTIRLEEGQAIELIDTAGITTTEPLTPIDNLAQQLAVEQHHRADLTVVCLDGSRPLTAEDRRLLSQTAPLRRLLVRTKSDLPPRWEFEDLPAAAETGLQVCALRADGVEALRRRLSDHFATAAAAEPIDLVRSTAVRSLESLRMTQASLARAHAVAAEGASDELIAAELRLALDGLGMIVGEIYTDDLLDRVFSRFCIGK